MKRYILQWKFHVYNIQFQEVRIEDREECFDKFEDLLKCYRQKKNALFAETIHYNTDFRVFTCIMEEHDISQLDALL